MQVSTHNQDTPAANKQHKIEDQLPEYFNHGRILAPLAGIIPDLSFNLVGHHGVSAKCFSLRILFLCSFSIPSPIPFVQNKREEILSFTPRCTLNFDFLI